NTCRPERDHKQRLWESRTITMQRLVQERNVDPPHQGRQWQSDGNAPRDLVKVGQLAEEIYRPVKPNSQIARYHVNDELDEVFDWHQLLGLARGRGGLWLRYCWLGSRHRLALGC